MQRKNNTFTDAVLSVVRTIPKGSVLTYAQVAKRAGNPKAYRAVATIMAKNYLEEVPCHRVIRSDGGMGGYNRGGVKKKRAILQAEGFLLANSK